MKGEKEREITCNKSKYIKAEEEEWKYKKDKQI